MSNKPETCDRCHKVVHGFVIEIGNIHLCGECYAYLNEQQQQQHAVMTKNVAEHVKRSWK